MPRSPVSPPVSPRDDEDDGDDASDGDDALMAAFAAGDARAFERLYARHEAGLYRFVRRLLGAQLGGHVDEVFQDVWLSVVKTRDRWRADGGAAFRTWLFTLAHHRVIDILRRSGREVSSDAADDADGDGPAAREPWQPADGVAWQHWPVPVSSALHGDELAFWRHAGEKLLDCLEQLPAPQKSAFLLHHDDGLSLDDVARALEVGFETAKTRLRYAMAKLRTCMGAYLEPLRSGGAT